MRNQIEVIEYEWISAYIFEKNILFLMLNVVIIIKWYLKIERN